MTTEWLTKWQAIEKRTDTLTQTCCLLGSNKGPNGTSSIRSERYVAFHFISGMIDVREDRSRKVGNNENDETGPFPRTDSVIDAFFFVVVRRSLYVGGDKTEPRYQGRGVAVVQMSSHRNRHPEERGLLRGRQSKDGAIGPHPFLSFYHKAFLYII